MCRQWSTTHRPGGLVKRQEPWTQREALNEPKKEDEKQEVIDDDLKEAWLTKLREDENNEKKDQLDLFKTALVPLVRETYDMMSEMYYELAEAKREVCQSLATATVRHCLS